MKAHLLVTFISHLTIAAEMSGETCSSDQLQGTEGDILLQSKQSSHGSLSMKNSKDTPMEYPILPAGVDNPQESLVQARQTPDGSDTVESSQDMPTKPMEYDTKGELVGMSAAMAEQSNSEVQSEESFSLDQNESSSSSVATESQNNVSTYIQNGATNAVLAETETPALTAEVVFAVSATMTMMISTMLLRTESAMTPMKTKCVGRSMMEAESSKTGQ